MGNNVRIARYEAIILRVINETITREVNNKIVKFARVTYVTLTNDLSLATCYIDCLDRTKIDQVLDNLAKLTGFFRSKIAQNIDTYKTPVIKFKIDKTIDYAQNIDKIIESIKKSKEEKGE